MHKLNFSLQRFMPINSKGWNQRDSTLEEQKKEREIRERELKEKRERE